MKAILFSLILMSNSKHTPSTMLDAVNTMNSSNNRNNINSNRYVSLSIFFGPGPLLSTLFVLAHSFLQKFYTISTTLTITILQMRKLKHRALRWLIQGQTTQWSRIWTLLVWFQHPDILKEPPECENHILSVCGLMVDTRWLVCHAMAFSCS